MSSEIEAKPEDSPDPSAESEIHRKLLKKREMGERVQTSAIQMEVFLADHPKLVIN